MKTSNFWHYPTGENRIVIARAVPQGIEAGYRRYPKLAPGSWFKNPEYKNNQETYRERYFTEILAPLSPVEVWEELHQLADSEEPILLCWEKLSIPAATHASPAGFAGQDNPTTPGFARHSSKSEAWCHRRMAAEWFEKSLGITVPEYVPAEQSANQLELL